MQSSPLTDTELDRLEEMLSQSKNPSAMTLEMVDGFFAALLCGPELVMPSEYMPEVAGAESGPVGAFASLDEVREYGELIMRHWNSRAQNLLSGKVFVPILSEDEQGVAHGNDFAVGFMRGAAMRPDSWQELFDDDAMGMLIPILALRHEHDPDPELRPYKEPINAALREKLIIGMAAGVMKIYKHFRPHRMAEVANATKNETWQGRRKVGRNDSCPCGSGKKFKRCCGSAKIQ